MANFEELVATGMSRGLALVTKYEDPPADLLAKLSFADIKEAYDAAECPLRMRLLENLRSRACTFQELHFVHDKTDGAEQSRIFRQIETLELSFEEWHKSYEGCHDSTSLRDLAWRKALGVGTFDQLLRKGNDFSCWHLGKKATTYEQWHIVWKRAQKVPDWMRAENKAPFFATQKTALTSMIVLATTVGQVDEIFKWVPAEMRGQAIAKLRELAKD